ncbi:cobalamin biosynthesis protein CbiB [Clostridium homopropionicum DSM 5847]|uniref:Cobalamin biosynthesis protein CobD n=1 Tax=Clostridium homopropionicum DSM 5847 TaxID=1121318 RepID=A0A0L6Z9X0_9CLOT|nr:adenosylcobinamide-phosphate synthase CbiB [Clostridium homopropionicum]KOA19766.1 cobalamin biosynthesis protein CbiB [Clostridium homopropionicum DSM 5847]SFF77993.1 adenosylcobinamide-phosphate synthase [Clostridium homopropionicum]
MEDFLVINSLDVIAAVIIDLILGDPYWLPHPIIFIGKLIKIIENKMRATAKNNKQLKYLGGIMVLIVVLICFLLPAIILYFTWSVKPLFHVVNIMLLWTTIAAKSLKEESMKVYFALEKKDIALARKFTSYIVGRETQNLDEKQLIRATVETVAENTSDGVIAPLFYGFIGGAPLAMMYKGINTMDSMVGYLNELYTYFGFFSAKTDDVFNFIPARITGFFMCMTALFMKASCYNSLKIMIRDRNNHKSPNCAYPEAAVAAILKVQLGGNNIYFGEVVEKPTIGDKTRELQREDIVSSNKIMFLTEFLFAAIATIIVYLT